MFFRIITIFLYFEINIQLYDLGKIHKNCHQAKIIANRQKGEIKQCPLSPSCVQVMRLCVIIVVTHSIVMRLLQFKQFYTVGTKLLKICEPDGSKPQWFEDYLVPEHDIWIDIFPLLYYVMFLSYVWIANGFKGLNVTFLNICRYLFAHVCSLDKLWALEYWGRRNFLLPF